MTASSWLIVALILLGCGVVFWIALAWRDQKQHEAEVEAAKHTEDEVKGWSAAAIEREKKRSDEEALKKWQENFGPGD